MQIEVGSIYEGKVTGITKFGAFVEIAQGKTGMVHISEVSNTFVNEIKDHLKEGQTVKVKVLNVGDDGKISLSIKKALPPPERPAKPRNNDDFRANKKPPVENNNRKPVPEVSFNEKPVASSGNMDFEDMLNKFKQSSEEKMSDIKKNMDNKRRSTSRRGNGRP